jgi:hypothetical protein
MAKVCDYAIVVDDRWGPLTNSERNWTTPGNTHRGSRSVLAFMLHLDCDDTVHLTFRINGIKAGTYTFTDGSHFRAIHEVVTSDLLVLGEKANTFSVDSSSDDDYRLYVSDVIVWCQVEV